MSFATEVKKEILGNDYSDVCQKAIVAGILQGSAEIILKDNELSLRLTSFMPSIIRFLVPFFKKVYQINVETFFLDRTNINKRRIYCLNITEKVEDIIQEYHLYPFDAYELADPIFKTQDAKKAFVAGCFLSKGSISDPRKSSYHFEILNKKQETAELIARFLKEANISSNIITKINQYLLYIKRSETISDALAYIGAYSGVLHFEDYRIMRDMNNAVNRAMNCDIANYKRSLEYCKKQMEAIQYIKERHLDDTLSLRLKDAIRLREIYPDATLLELSEYSENVLGKHLSKSGISHCMKEIMDYYEDLKTN